MLAWLDSYIGRDTDISPEHRAVMRTIWALFGFQAVCRLAQEYPALHDPAYFHLPLWGDGRSAASVQSFLHVHAHNALVYSGLLWCLLLILPWPKCRRIGICGSVGAAGLACVLCYVLLSDHLGFRHVWVLLANVYLCLAVIVWPQSLKRGLAESTIADSEAAQPGPQAYGLAAVRGFFCLVYLLAGLAKMNSGFLSGEVIDELTSQWGANSSIRTLVDAVPYSLPLMAWSSLWIELLIPICLLLPRWRSWGIGVGLLFHTAVPLVGWVGHSLNLYLVASYLFFVWPRGDRPMLNPQDLSDAARRLIDRLDRCRRIRWSPDATSAGRGKLLWIVARHTLYGNPLFWWYAAAWYLLLLLQFAANGWVYVPAVIAALTVAIREVRLSGALANRAGKT